MIALSKPAANFSRSPLHRFTIEPLLVPEKEIRWTNQFGVHTPWYPLSELAERQHFFDINWSVGWRTRTHRNGPWAEKTR
jgi:hypothetical protein